MKKWEVENELQVKNYELRMRSSALFQSATIYVSLSIFFLADQRWSFSRWFTLIYFLRSSAISICEYLRELFFLNFLTHAQISPQNYSLLKIRGVPPKAGRCYELIDNWQIIMDNIGEVKKSEMGIENCQLRITENHPVNKSSNR